MRQRFDAIYCRNVVIYFSDETQRELWPRFAEALLPGGWLFLGHSERVTEPETLGLTPSGVTSYRKINDPAKLAAYAKLAGPAITPFGGRYLARGTAVAAFEAGLKERIVISEFPSVEKALAAHDGPAYQEALRVLGDGADREIRTVEGLE